MRVTRSAVVLACALVLSAALGIPARASSTPQPAWPLPLASSARLANGEYRIAGDGSVEVDYTGEYGGAGWTFNPVSTSHECLAAYVEARGGSRTSGPVVIRSADALLRRARPIGSGIGFRYPLAIPILRMPPGWISGMAQGLGMACEAAAYTLTRDKRYLAGAAALYRVLAATYGRNGTATSYGKGIFYEEIAGPQPPAHILNGMIFALAGLWFTNAIDPEPGYKRSLDEGLAAVRSTIDAYDAPGDSLYDQGPRSPALIGPWGGYDLVHVMQLRWLYQLTNDPHLLEMALRFYGYQRRIPFTAWVAHRGVRTSGTGWGGAFRPVPSIASVKMNLATPAFVDRVQIIASEAGVAPAQVTIAAGKSLTTVRPKSRFIDVAIPAQTVSSIRLTLTPRTRSSVGVSLLTLSNPQIRSLAAVPSDLSSAPDVRYLYDGNARTAWTGAPNVALIVRIGEVRYIDLQPGACSNPKQYGWSFSSDLKTWSPSVSAGSTAGAPIPVPPQASYAKLEWTSAGGCLTELAGTTSP